MSDIDKDDQEEDDAVYGGSSDGSTLLGVLCGPLDEPYLSDITTSRAGGRPVWCGGRPPKSLEDPSALLTCKICGSLLWLVAQVYAPVGSLNRALHIFGCNQRTCALKQGAECTVDKSD